MSIICSGCVIEKDDSEFSKRSDSKTGRRARCKDCESHRRRQYYDANRDILLEKRKIYVQNNIETMNT